MAVQNWNPSDKNSGCTLSNSNLTAAGNTTTFACVRATKYRTTGKWYWELTLALTTGSQINGIADSTMTENADDNVGGTGVSAGTRSSGTTFVSGMTKVNDTGVTWAAGDRMDFAIDYDAGKAWIGKNGTWCASGNPASGTNPWVAFTANTSLTPGASVRNTTESATANFGNSAFTDTKPSGFTAFQVDALALTAAAGAYTLTGIAATLVKTKLLICGTGSYVLTGVAQSLTKALHLTPATGAYVLTGIAQTLTRARFLVAATGVYVLTGVAQTVKKALHLIPATGSYALTGVAQTLKKALHLTAGTGSYALTGVAAGLIKAYHLVAGTGSYVLTGTALIVAHLVAPASKFKLRLAPFVLQKLRTTAPTLED